MKQNKILIFALVLGVVLVGGYVAFQGLEINTPLDATPQNKTLSGTYVCLPHLDTTGPQTEECAFGLKTDDGNYAVNFGESATSSLQFRHGERITTEGFVVIKEALSSDYWMKYDIKGVFTITKIISPAPVQGKLNIDTVCNGALAYMTFPDGKSAEAFLADCKEGKRPEVIERYKQEMNLGDGATL